MRRRNFAQLVLAGACSVFALGPLHAQSNTNAIMVGFAAGGSVDSGARLLSDQLQRITGDVYIVDNRTGAAGRLAVGHTQRARPDGKTLMLVPHGPMTLFPHLFTNLGFEPLKDFTPVAQVAQVDYALVAANNVPASNSKELLEWVKANPSQASFGTPGTGTIPHFIGETVAKRMGVELLNVPYKGSALTVNDVVAGILPLGFMPLADALPMAKAGRLKVIATTGSQRSPLAPDYPTLKEQGVDFELDGWYAVYGPADMEPAKVASLTQAIKEALAMEDLQRRYADVGLTAAYRSPDELRELMSNELNMWGEVVKETGFKPLD